MDNWREEYRKNFTAGIIISVAVHFIFLIVILLMPQLSQEPSNDYFDNTYTVKLSIINLGQVDAGGGGSSGNGENDPGVGALSNKTISGTPVPVHDAPNVEFGKETNLSEPKDSLSKPGGGGNGTGSGTGIGSGSGSGIGPGSGWGVGYKSLPFVPKQILEVLPQNVDGEKGEILLLLKIGKDGYVKEHKVIMNTVNDPIGLKNVLEAAYKSRWEKIKIEETQIEYWIEKKYIFN